MQVRRAQLSRYDPRAGTTQAEAAREEGRQEAEEGEVATRAVAKEGDHDQAPARRRSAKDDVKQRALTVKTRERSLWLVGRSSDTR